MPCIQVGAVNLQHASSDQARKEPGCAPVMPGESMAPRRSISQNGIAARPAIGVPARRHAQFRDQKFGSCLNWNRTAIAIVSEIVITTGSSLGEILVAAAPSDAPVSRPINQSDNQRGQNRDGLERSHYRDSEWPHAIDKKSDYGNKDADETPEKVTRRSHWAHRAQVSGDAVCDMPHGSRRRRIHDNRRIERTDEPLAAITTLHVFLSFERQLRHPAESLGYDIAVH